MLNEEQERYLAQLLRPMQIIVLALMAGPGAFLAFVLFTRNGQPADPHMSYMAVGFAAIACLAWLIVPQVITAINCSRIAAGQSPFQQRQGFVAPPGAEQVGQLAGVYQVRLIVASAILEGAAFFNIYAFMVEQQTWTLAIVAALLLLILFGFPTMGRLTSFVRQRLESMEQFPR